MRLLSKLTLFTTISKIAILLLFIAILPYLIDRVAFNTTNYQLRQQEEKVFSNIRENGIDYYLEGDSSYASYTMLKDEYISIASAFQAHLPDTVMTTQRVIENDTLNYRILSRNFEYEKKAYNLEIGRTISSISQYNRPLQRIALYVLAGLILITLFADLAYTRVLLRPLARIVKVRVKNNRFPFKRDQQPVKTSTTDFRSLDESLIKLMQQVNTDFDREREFTSNASHELLTPIGILQSKIENLLLATEDEELQAKFIDQMRTLNRLKKIVNSLLLISRIENEQYKREQEVDLPELVQEVVEELEHRIEQRGLTLQSQMSIGQTINATNRDLLFQMVHNLVNNAVRYNRDAGSIRIADELDEKGYSLLISDTGVGIPAAELSVIFQRFRKGAAGNEEGFGLGLSIVKSIADYLGLELQVQSEPGEGTCFRIRFPESQVRLHI